MNVNLQPLPPPDSFDQSSSMWVDEAIWGHRLYDEQTPWMVFLEFLNVFHYEQGKNRAFEEPHGLNMLEYRAPRNLYLRNVLFNNPHLAKIQLSYPNDNTRWVEWLRAMTGSATGINHPRFEYLRNHFHAFDDFSEVVSLIRSTSLEVNSNKRWTSKFVFPYGKHCLYEDLDDKFTNDRRFFARTGEVLYLMLCRAQSKDQLLDALTKRLNETDPTMDSIVKCLQPSEEEDLGTARANAFLPYKHHPSFDELAKDWLAILWLNIPGFDVFPHLVYLAGLHLLKYQLGIALQILGHTTTSPTLICEVVAPKKTLVREISSDQYHGNNLLPAKAIDAFLNNIEVSTEWQHAVKENDAFQKCKAILKDKVRWGDDYQGPIEPQRLIASLREAAMKRHRQHVANIHRNYGKAIGLVSMRGTNKLRYAPTDGFLKTLIFANVKDRLELNLFLQRLHSRYGLVFSDKEAETVLSKDEFDKKAFQANSRRLEQRLGSVGLLRRLSDGCAYVVNPYKAKIEWQ
jgi:hypothetical protein